MGQVETGELGLVRPDLRLQAFDLGSQGPGPGVVGAGLGGLLGAGRDASAGDLADALAARSALERVELVAQLLVAGQLFEVGAPIARGDGVERVRRVAERRLRLGVKLVEAAVAILAHPRPIHLARV